MARLERELKFVLDRPRVHAFFGAAAENGLALETHEASAPVAYSRTTYLDSDDHDLFRSEAEVRRRLRIREYAAAPDLLAAPILTGVSFLELKESSSGIRRKVRIRLSSPALRQLLTGEAPPEAIEAIGQQADPKIAEDLRAKRYRPQMTTWYRRTSLISTGLRVTLDHGVAFCRPAYLGDRGCLATPAETVAVWPGTVLEIKLAGALPGWLATQLDGLNEEIGLSKFEAGMHAMTGHAVRAA